MNLQSEMFNILFWRLFNFFQYEVNAYHIFYFESYLATSRQATSGPCVSGIRYCVSGPCVSVCLVPVCVRESGPCVYVSLVPVCPCIWSPCVHPCVSVCPVPACPVSVFVCGPCASVCPVPVCLCIRYPCLCVRFLCIRVSDHN